MELVAEGILRRLKAVYELAKEKELKCQFYCVIYECCIMKQTLRGCRFLNETRWEIRKLLSKYMD